MVLFLVDSGALCTEFAVPFVCMNCKLKVLIFIWFVSGEFAKISSGSGGGERGGGCSLISSQASSLSL